MSEHAKELEPKIQRIKEHPGRMTSEGHTDKLLAAIYKPGFTTPREAMFVHHMVDSMAHRLDGLERELRALVAAAEEIARAKAA